MITNCQPEPRVSLILAQQSFGVAIHSVKGGEVRVGGCPVGPCAALTLVWVVKGPHPCPVIVVLTPKMLFGFKHKRHFFWCPILSAAYFSTPTYRWPFFCYQRVSWMLLSWGLASWSSPLICWLCPEHCFSPSSKS